MVAPIKPMLPLSLSTLLSLHHALQKQKVITSYSESKQLLPLLNLQSSTAVSRSDPYLCRRDMTFNLYFAYPHQSVVFNTYRFIYLYIFFTRSLILNHVL